MIPAHTIEHSTYEFFVSETLALAYNHAEQRRGGLYQEAAMTAEALKVATLRRNRAASVVRYIESLKLAEQDDQPYQDGYPSEGTSY